MLGEYLRHDWRRRVRVEFLYGTCGWRLEMAVKTSPSADSDLLIACVSLSLIDRYVVDR